jgi:hypothetical protein
MRAVEIALLLVQTVAVLITIRYAKQTVRQGKDTAAMLERERYSRQLADLIDVVSRLDLSLRQADPSTAATLQIRLRALLIPLATPQEMPRAFELADGAVRTDDERIATHALVGAVVDELREAAASRHRVIRVPSITHERALGVPTVEQTSDQ